MFSARYDKNVISVVIPVYGNASGLEKTLVCIKAQRPVGRTMKVLVANDGADPHVAQVCRHHSVSMVTISPRRGSYFARNRALERITGDWVVFLDAGIQVPDEWIERALATIGTADYLACEVDIAPVLRPTASEAYESIHAYPIEQYMRQMHFGGAGNLIVKQKVLETIGGFDERLYSGGDLEFGNRVYRAGFRQVYLPQPVLLHPPRHALSLFLKQFRVKIGHRQLARLYPDRFPSRSAASLLAALLRAFIPPRPRAVREEFPAAIAIPVWRRFFFLWLLKLCHASAGLTALFVPAPGPPKTPKRIEWFDFIDNGC